MVDFTCYEEQIFETWFAISYYFKENPGTTKFPAADLMPYLEEKKILKKTQGERTPIEALLDLMNERDHINVFPWALGEGDPNRLQWFFVFLKGYSLKELEEKMTDEQTSKFIEFGDENYLLDLCDEIIGQKALRQHLFHLRDKERSFPVHGYYSELNLALYYQKPPQSEVVTRLKNISWVSGRSLHREKEEEEFLQKCRELLAERGIQLLEIHHSNFSHYKLKRLQKTEKADVEVLKQILSVVK